VLDDIEPKGQIEGASIERQRLAGPERDDFGVAELAHVGTGDSEATGEERFGEADRSATHIERGEGRPAVIEQRLGQPGEQAVALIDIRLVTVGGPSHSSRSCSPVAGSPAT
jgi:hypothetical protein